MIRLQLQKERLTAFVVHDLKNPVSSMDLFAQTLLRDRRLPEDVREMAPHVLTHRLVVSDEVTPEAALQAAMNSVPTPVPSPASAPVELA